MCTDDEIVAAVASLRFLEPPQALDLEPATFDFPVSDSEIAERPFWEKNWDWLEAAEHQATAEDLKIRQTNDVLTAPTEPVVFVDTKKNERIPLTFGRIIALAGDFYTNREPTKGSEIGLDYAPICGALQKSKSAPLKRFENAVNSLLQDRDGYLAQITKLLDHEHRTVGHARELGKSVSKTYHEGGIEDHFDPDNCKLPGDKEYFDALKDSWEIIQHPSYNLMLSMYAWLAFTNVDHFGEDAVKAYCIGHASAMRLAAEAHNEQDATKKCQKLKEAYVHEAFAAHYLTDLFSSGHLRPARRYLHTQDRVEMAAAGVMQWDKLGGKPEVPIWDYQGRYMHDDDCATGLLVRNGNGDQWIAYGDKQFFEPKNAVNRARAAHCLQESVDEVYNKGFKQGWNPIPNDKPEEENSWEEYSSSFAARQLMPLPMTALKSSNWIKAWDNCDVHNPAPLWVAGTPNSQDRVPDHDFTLRKDVNDHSNFARVASSPASEKYKFPRIPGIPYENEDCRRVRDASFRGDDQFAQQSVMDGLLSGSFVQVQDLIRNVAAPEHGKLTCVNFWNPALVEISSKTQQTFTIRNRSINAVDLSDLPDTALPIHWALQNSVDLTITILYGFYWVADEDKKHARIAFNNTSFRSWIGGMGERQKLNLSESWEARAFRSMNTITLSSNLPVGSAPLTRFLFDKFLVEEGDHSEIVSDRDLLQILAVSVLPGKKVQIAICDDRRVKWRESPFNTIQSLQSPCFGFAKAFNTGQHQKNLLLCNANFTGGKSKLDLYEYKFEGADPEQITVIDAHTRLECKINSEEEGDSSVLVGDVLGVGSDQVVVISGDYNNPEMQLYSRSMEASTPSAFTLAGRSAFDEGDYCDDKLIRPYLTALVPSCTGKGSDVLRIALHQRKDGRKYLYFHTHVRSATTAPGPKSVIWTQYRSSEVYDKLADNKNGHYFHIKFIPTRRELKYKGSMTTVPAILEVFSWYGVLGVRMFAASSPNECDYELEGQQPFLGQTSIGAGLGCSGDWGQGFLPWNDKDRWVDSNVFIPLPGSKEVQGSWGMTLDDQDRQPVRGWEVEKRPH
ncbi:uncharacterized protein N7479_002033 [Penicillium vulpinum]|uniref:Uncharacterized protein n=1 Tax=Penicillium vulpinum TaxID=29845 RepID=A0A1V6S4J3_9EURO|nr:uncharacterized protein N7479_002033 [Penicillium vulpinum]KAJ5972115.1 hypothetical protein N7479_002033 [Penicillium vulpinum]OQE08972.1 hypothetical protein PENVUL_c008G04382 [Penicillium vulpinum]